MPTQIFNNESTYTAKLKNLFLDKYKTTFPNEEIEELNLYDINVPRIEGDQLLNVWNKQSLGESLSDDETKLLICRHSY